MQWTLGLLLVISVATIVSAQPAATETTAGTAALAPAQQQAESGPIFPSPVEADVLKWLNIARTDPKGFRQSLHEMMQKFDEKNPLMYHIDGDPVALLTTEGRIPVVEAIKALKVQETKPALKALMFADGLNRAAREHARDMGTFGLYSHTGTDGSSAWDRIRRYGKWKVKAAENMRTGFNSGLHIVRYLMVDDGEPDRSHRINILSPEFERVGISVQPHKVYDWVVVIDFTGAYTERRQPLSEEAFSSGIGQVASTDGSASANAGTVQKTA